MAIILQRVELVTTTKRTDNSGTDSKVAILFTLGNHPYTSLNVLEVDSGVGWSREDDGSYSRRIDEPGNVREKGKTDSFPIDFDTVNSHRIVLKCPDHRTSPGIPVPFGIAFSNMSSLKRFRIRIQIRGNDMWRVERYHLNGLIFEQNEDDSFPEIGRPILMATREEDFSMSADTGDAAGITAIHTIILNGTF